MYVSFIEKSFYAGLFIFNRIKPENFLLKIKDVLEVIVENDLLVFKVSSGISYLILRKEGENFWSMVLRNIRSPKDS